MTKLRIGHGYDVHRLAAGRSLVLGGVAIPMTVAWTVIPMPTC